MDAPERLRAFFNDKDWTQRDAAKALSVSQAHVSGILDRRCSPGADLRVKIETLTTAAAGGPIRYADWPAKKRKKPKTRRPTARTSSAARAA